MRSPSVRVLTKSLYSLVVTLSLIAPQTLSSQRITQPPVRQQQRFALTGTLPSSRLQRDRRLVPSRAPSPESRKFVAGDWYVSPRVWISGVEEGATAYGASIERAITTTEDEGDGVWAVGVSFDRYTYTYASVVDVSIIPIGALVAYHFSMENTRLDPYVGAGLGYYIVSMSADETSVRGSTTFFQSQLGMRYFVTEAFSLGAHVGTGIGSVAFGATLRF